MVAPLAATRNVTAVTMMREASVVRGTGEVERSLILIVDPRSVRALALAGGAWLSPGTGRRRPISLSILGVLRALAGNLPARPEIHRRARKQTRRRRGRLIVDLGTGPSMLGGAAI